MRIEEFEAQGQQSGYYWIQVRRQRPRSEPTYMLSWLIGYYTTAFNTQNTAFAGWVVSGQRGPQSAHMLNIVRVGPYLGQEPATDDVWTGEREIVEDWHSGAYPSVLLELPL